MIQIGFVHCNADIWMGLNIWLSFRLILLAEMLGCVSLIHLLQHQFDAAIKRDQRSEVERLCSLI